MTITIDPGTRTITVEQSDLTPVSGTLYEMDTEAFRHAVGALMDDEMYIWLPQWVDRNPPYVVFGATYAQKLAVINGFSVEFDDTPGAYSVRLVGSNNDIGDIQGGILVQNTVQVIPTNSAGLIQVNTATVDTDKIVQTVEDWGAINYSK